VSDDEDEDDAPVRQPARRKGKARAMDPDLDDMMALDDSQPANYSFIVTS